MKKILLITLAVAAFAGIALAIVRKVIGVLVYAPARYEQR